MSVFFDELQKQYQNMENKASQAYNTGINMLGQKFNMMNQLFSNKMQTLGTGANILSQASQIPSSMASMFGNIVEQGKTRAQQENQFNKSYALDVKRINTDSGYRDRELAFEREKYQFGKEQLKAEQQKILDEENRIYAPQVQGVLVAIPDNNFRSNQIKYVKAMRSKGVPEREIFNRINGGGKYGI